jgi:SAM-dependent methyltransferase
LVDPTQRFTGLADTYAHHRPEYPREAIDHIAQLADLKPGDRVADVGCGTGISTRILAARGWRVVGIEPNDDMRWRAERDSAEPACIEYISAAAEATGLTTESVALVIAAQAFHWFQPLSALEEFHRILAPAGVVALVWNERDEFDPFTKAYGDVLRRHPEALEQESRRRIAYRPLFDSPLFVEARLDSFPNHQTLIQERLIGRAFSSSYAPKPGTAHHDVWTTGICSVFERFAVEGNVVLRYMTLVYTARRR